MDVEKEFNEYFENGNGKGNDKDKKKEPSIKKIPIKKYSENGKGPLYESVVIGGFSKFVTLDKDLKPVFVDNIKRVNDILIPSDTIDTQNPLPFIFDSKEELEHCLELAKEETLETLFVKQESINRKYVDIEDHYHVLITADMMWTWLQDRFGYTHYDILVGDNDSGKNSQLLVFKYLGYRTFYTVSASAPNYFTKMGNVEEGQITIAEDEAEDIALDREKRNVFKSGYASGASVPKVDLENGRKSDDWLVYCFKLVAMEELPTHKDMKGILDRSFVFKFVSGTVPYNIKDVIRSAGDPKFKPLYDELMNTRKLMFCWRLVHYNDIILDVELNIKNRSAELTKPLIRLFQNSPIALKRIIDSLSKFMFERNEVRKGSFESKLYDVIDELKNEREQRFKDGKETDDDKILSEKKDGYDLAFSNPELLEKTIEIMDCKETRKNNIYWSEVVGSLVTQTRITSVCKSKFKGDSFQQRLTNPLIEGDTKGFRCVRFKRKYLDRIKGKYEIPDKILVSPVSPVSPSTGILPYYTDIMIAKISTKDQNCFENSNNTIEKTSIIAIDGSIKQSSLSLKSDTTDTSDTKNEGLGKK